MIIDYKKVAETLGDIREPYDQETSKAIDAAIALCEAAACPEDEREHCHKSVYRMLDAVDGFDDEGWLKQERAQARAEGYALGQGDIGGRNFNLFEYDKLQAKYDALEAAARVVDDMATRYGSGDQTIDLYDLQRCINKLRELLP